jgi:hypothetical protein
LRSITETRDSDFCIVGAESRVQSVALAAVSLAPESAFLESGMPGHLERVEERMAFGTTARWRTPSPLDKDIKVISH